MSVECILCQCCHEGAATSEATLIRFILWNKLISSITKTAVKEPQLMYSLNMSQNKKTTSSSLTNGRTSNGRTPSSSLSNGDGKNHIFTLNGYTKWTAIPTGNLKIKFQPRRDTETIGRSLKWRQRLQASKNMKKKHDLEFNVPDTQRLNGVVPKITLRGDFVGKINKSQLLDYLNVGQLKRHIESVRSEIQQRKMRNVSAILIKLMEHPRNRKGLFNAPVDPIALNLPTYFQVVETPMDLGTVRRKLEAQQYRSVDYFSTDVRLVFQNAMLFNPTFHGVHVDAKALMANFQETILKFKDKQHAAELQAETHACKVCLGNTCPICQEKCLEFSLPNVFCSGNCGVPIRRGIVCYTTRDGTRAWCSKCYNKGVKLNRPSKGSLKATGSSPSTPTPPTTPKMSNVASTTPSQSFEPLRLQKEPKLNQVKDELEKKRCEVDVEPWVKCDECKRWCHQICGCFNAIVDHFAERPQFICPLCRITRFGKDLSPVAPRELQMDAKHLPSTDLCSYMETFVFDDLRKHGHEKVVDTLCIRVVSCASKRQAIPCLVRQAFAQNNQNHNGETYPAGLPYVSKAIYLFQKQEDMDVVLFAIYVQEYDEDVQTISNQRSVYLAYLDSVQYLRPASIRTRVYHHMLAGYFDYARRKGFEKVHIWSCPPHRNVSYVFWCRPSHQRTPSTDHLRDWYKNMLEVAKELGVIASWTTFHKAYFAPLSSSNGDVDRSSFSSWPRECLPPCFDGDFWPAEADRLVRRKVKNGSTRTKYMDQISTNKNDFPSILAQNQSPIYLQDVFETTEACIKSMKDDLLVVLLKPIQGGGGEIITSSSSSSSKDASSFVASRHAFHQLCAQSNYQFDSLRRAKHSTMMILHHLFQPELQQSHTFCDECGLLITNTELWRCSDCPDFTVCDWCKMAQHYRHPHTLHFGRI